MTREQTLRSILAQFVVAVVAMTGLTVALAQATSQVPVAVNAPGAAAESELFGGLGVVSGVPVEQLYREIRALRIYEGASEVQQQIIARQLLAEMPNAGW